jgi:hypothetical protein
MFSWFKNKAEDVKPLPLSQREKSYSAASGFVYQYIFKGMAGRRHVFSVSADRKNHFEVSIELVPDSLKPCVERMGSDLRWNEEYALVKLCLFSAFDEAVCVEDLQRLIRPESKQLLEHMTTLNMA